MKAHPQSANLRLSILAALEHPEAEDGLYLRNFCYLHEEDERPTVVASQTEVLTALKTLVDEGKVEIDEEGEEPIFFLSRPYIVP